MAKKTKSYLERLREKAAAAVENKQQSLSSNGLEFIPPVGKTKVRLLPPKNLDQYFYHTHSYNFLPGASEDGKDVMLWTRKKYKDADGKEVKCPIDQAASEFFDSKDPTYRKFGSEIKRKRRFYFNAILVDEEDIDKKFVVLVDNTNEGKLTKQICSAMNLPLIRDIEDNWVVGEDQVDPEEEGVDLLDIENGHDFIITKTEEVVTLENGTTIRKAVFDSSKPSSKPRPLSQEERTLLDKRVDLTEFVKYEESLDVVLEYLERYLDSKVSNQSNKEDAKKKVTSKYTSPAIEAKAEVIEEKEEEDFDEETSNLLKELE